MSSSVTAAMQRSTRAELTGLRNQARRNEMALVDTCVRKLLPSILARCHEHLSPDTATFQTLAELHNEWSARCTPPSLQFRATPRARSVQNCQLFGIKAVVQIFNLGSNMIPAEMRSCVPSSSFSHRSGEGKVGRQQADGRTEGLRIASNDKAGPG